MAREKQKTMHEKWESASKEPGAGLHFHDAPDTGERAELEGFTDEELIRIMGDDEFRKYRQQRDTGIDEIDEIG